MVERFHADPRIQATELLLQERIPREAPVIEPRPAEETRAEPPALARAPRRFRSPHTPYPRAQILSNGSYVAIVTNGGGGTSFCRGRAVTRWREDRTRDPGKPVRLSARRPHGRRLVRDLPAHGQGARQLSRGIPRRESGIRTARPRDRNAARGRGLARGRRRGPARLADESERPPPRDRADELRRGRASGPSPKTSPTPRSGSSSSRRSGFPRTRLSWRGAGTRGAHDPALVGFHVLSIHGPTQAQVEWETDRMRFLGRGRGPDNPTGHGRARALGHNRRGARPDPEPPDPAAACTRGVRARLVHDRRCRRRGDRARVCTEVPRPRRRRPRLRPGVHAGADGGAASRRLRRTGPALRAARLPASSSPMPRSGPTGRPWRRTRSGRTASGGTGSRVISRSFSSA